MDDKKKFPNCFSKILIFRSVRHFTLFILVPTHYDLNDFSTYLFPKVFFTFQKRTKINVQNRKVNLTLGKNMNVLTFDFFLEFGGSLFHFSFTSKREIYVNRHKHNLKR
jgi:hypothetical protein